MSETTVSMPVSMLIGDEIVTVTADSTVAEVAQLMNDADIGAVVVGSADDVAGIVSERDLVRFVAGGGDADVVTAGEMATTTLVWCNQDSTVAEVANEMFEQYVRHVLVNSDTGLAGIVSARDLLGVYASDDSQEF